MTQYNVDKRIWSNDDFDVMGWHDAKLWSFVALPEQFEYAIDLDYIFQWVDPGPGETSYKFWIAPVTMVFENASKVHIDLDSLQGSIEINDLHRTPVGLTPNGKFTEYLFRFECHQGELSLQATSFKMYVRSRPVLLEKGFPTLSERGGVNFSRETFIS